jgi:hypothetical protein
MIIPHMHGMGFCFVPLLVASSVTWDVAVAPGSCQAMVCTCYSAPYNGARQSLAGISMHVT